MQSKGIRNRILSMLLATALICALLPMYVFAKDDEKQAAYCQNKQQSDGILDQLASLNRNGSDVEKDEAKLGELWEHVDACSVCMPRTLPGGDYHAALFAVSLPKMASLTATGPAVLTNTSITATIDLSGAISGMQSIAIAETPVTITLTGGTFNAIMANTRWETNLPGVRVKVATSIVAGSATASVVLIGTPTVASANPVLINIPGGALSSLTPLTTTAKEGANWNIAIATLEQITVPMVGGKNSVIISKPTNQPTYSFYYKTTATDDSANKPTLDSTALAGWALLSDSVTVSGTVGVDIYAQLIKVEIISGKIKGWGQGKLAPKAIESVPQGYTSDENGIMAYRYANDKQFDIQGVFDGKWKQTSFGNSGFTTELRIGEARTLLSFNGEENAIDNIAASFKGEVDLTNGGQLAQIRYTVKNTGAENLTFDLGSYADVQIGDDDSAAITKLGENRGFKMISSVDEDKSAIGDFAQFNFFGRGTANVTPVSDYWYGGYYEFERDPFVTEAQINTTPGIDSGMAYSWKNQTVAPNEEKVFTILIGIGGAGSENVAGGDKHDVVGEVKDNNGNPAVGAEIKVTKNGSSTGILKETVTDMNGKFTITGLTEGVYTITVTNPITGATITGKITIDGDKVTITELKLPTNGNQMTEVVTKTPETPNITVENLSGMFTPADIALLLEPGVSIQIRLSVEKLVDEPDNATIVTDALKGEQVVGMFLNAELIKTITGSAIQSNNHETKIQPPAGQKLTITIDLPADLQGKENYKIARVHNGKVDFLPTIYNANLQTLTFETDRFSTYAIVFGQTGEKPATSGGGGYSNYYDITLKAGEGGKIEPNEDVVSVLSGEDLTIKIVPDEGYQIADIKVDDKSVGWKGEYTFKEVRSDYVLTATFEKVDGTKTEGSQNLGDSQINNPKTSDNHMNVVIGSLILFLVFGTAILVVNQKGMKQE